MKKWEEKIKNFAISNESTITLILVIVAVALFCIACFGRPHHKAWALIYIIL